MGAPVMSKRVGRYAHMLNTCVLQPALVTQELLQAAQDKTDQLFSSLVMAKNDWQYAVKNQDEKYEKLLRVKAEYSEWRNLTQRLGDILDGKDDRAQALSEMSAGASQLFATLSSPRDGTRG